MNQLMPNNRCKVQVWDIYIRLFHWALAVAVITCFVALEINDMTLHMRAGSCILGLIIFRLLWGIWGSETARFTTFIKGPSAVLSYLKSGIQKVRGHSPLGALSVIFMLGLITFQVTAGLFSSAPDSFIYGPLAEEINSKWSKWFTHYHAEVGDIIKIFIGVHIVAILCYKFAMGKKLTAPMITGRDHASEHSLTTPLQVPHRRAAVSIVIATAAVYFLVYS